MTLTDEVTSAMSCSNAYCNNSQVVIVPADKAADYADVEACKALSFAVEAGSAGMAEVEKAGRQLHRGQGSGDRADGGRRRNGGRRRDRRADGRSHGRRGHELRQPDLHRQPERRGRRWQYGVSASARVLIWPPHPQRITRSGALPGAGLLRTARQQAAMPGFLRHAVRVLCRRAGGERYEAMVWSVTASLLEGFGMTLKIFGLTLAFAIPWGC